jgi:hypothetical protein
MPTYDPKANRPKLVPVDDDAAPVDALLGPEADAPISEPAPARPRLSVVGSDEPSPGPAAEPITTAPAPAGRRIDAKTAVVVAVVVAAVLGLVAVIRRR